MPTSHSAHTVKRPGETLLDAGIYLIKAGKPIDEPGEMLLIKNDPKYNEQWPRPLVPYKRIYGVDEPRACRRWPTTASSVAAPAGRDAVRPGRHVEPVQARELPQRHRPPGRGHRHLAGDTDKAAVPHTGSTGNWGSQGADAGLYTNDDIHAIRILAMEPTTDAPQRRQGRPALLQPRPRAAAHPRRNPGAQVRLARTASSRSIPTATPTPASSPRSRPTCAFTFQTLDKNGMVLNMAQTWHQVRPGEIRNDCGGCHAHSQKPTPFKDTAAAKPDYAVFDLTQQTPLLTTKTERPVRQASGTSRTRPACASRRASRTSSIHRDIKPILERSCVACHTQKAEKPAGNLVLDDDQLRRDHIAHSVPGTYYRLASDPKALFGHKPPGQSGWGEGDAQVALRLGVPVAAQPADLEDLRRPAGRLQQRRPPDGSRPRRSQHAPAQGATVEPTPQNRSHADVGYTGSIMPPPEAVPDNRTAAR